MSQMVMRSSRGGKKKKKKSEKKKKKKTNLMEIKKGLVVRGLMPQSRISVYQRM